MATTKQVKQSVEIHSWNSWYWKLGLAGTLVLSGAIIAAFEAPAQAATQEGKAITSLQIETLSKSKTLTESKTDQIKVNELKTTQIYAGRFRRPITDKNGGTGGVTFAPHTTLPSDYGEIQQLLGS